MSNNAPVQTESDGPGEPPSEEVRVKRGLNRASYDQEVVHEILDSGWLAHVGTIRDGKPVVIPMFYVRDGDSLLIHGAPASGVIRRGKGMEVCVTVTYLDGYVLARSAFHHSVNYRCVVIVGEAELVTEKAEKEAALDLFVENLVPGRMQEVRPTTEKEIKGTHVLRVSLEKSSAKVRNGDPVDDEEDYSVDTWAGVVPIESSLGQPIKDTRLADNIELPTNLQEMTGFDTARTW